MAGMYQGDPMRVQGLYNPQQGGFGSLAAPQIPASAQQTMQMVQQMPAQEAKPGAWSKGGKAWQILGIIGDGLQVAGGGKGTFMPAFLDMQEQARKERETQQKLAAEAAAISGLDLTPQQQAAVRAGVANYGDFKPKTNDTINDFEWYKTLSPEDRALYHKMKPVYRQGPDGQFYAVDVAPLPQTAPKGVTFTPIDGGPTQPASGGFRR